MNAVKLEQELLLLAFRDFGLKDVFAFANRQYNFGRKDTPTPYQYIVLMSDLKKEVRTAMDLILVNVRIANRVRVDSEMEFYKRLEHQNKALFYIEVVIVHLNKIVDVFNVDINSYKNVIELLYLEQKLINKWIKSDKKRYTSG